MKKYEFKVGDKVKCIENNGSDFDLTIGEVYTVEKIRESGSIELLETVVFPGLSCKLSHSPSRFVPANNRPNAKVLIQWLSDSSLEIETISSVPVSVQAILKDLEDIPEGSLVIKESKKESFKWILQNRWHETEYKVSSDFYSKEDVKKINNPDWRFISPIEESKILI